MIARVYITLKKGVLDAQGQAVAHALASLGFSDVGDVRVGKYIEMKLAATSREAAEREAQAICQKVLANPVMESFRFDLVEA